MTTVKVSYTQEELLAIIRQHYPRPFDPALISLGDYHQFADQYTQLMLTESRSGPSIGKLAQILTNKLIKGILTVDLPDPPECGDLEWRETEW